MHPQQPYQPSGQPGFPQQPYQPGYQQPGQPQQPYQPPSGQAGFPQPFGAPAQAQPGVPIDVDYTCDERTAGRLARGSALVSWRLPALWFLMLALPAFLLARGTISVLSKGGDAEIGEMMGAFFIVLGFELVIACLATGWKMVNSSKFAAVAGPGHRIVARYTADTMSLQQTSGQVANRYADIKKVIVVGDVVFLQPNGTQGFMLPREVVPDAALARLRSARD